MPWVVKGTNTTQPKQWVVKSNNQPKTPKESNFKPIRNAWNWTTNQLIKPAALASNALEDAGKTIAYPIAKLAGYKGNFQDARKQLGIKPIQNQLDVLTGKNQRIYSDITRDAASSRGKAAKIAGNIVGYGGDIFLDPLNKVKIAALTTKGVEAAKTGKVALSVAEQADKGQRALLQFGKYNVVPGRRILAASTKANDALRATNIGNKLMNVGSKVSGKIRPGGVTREEFKILTDAKTAARDTIGYATNKSIQFGKELEQVLRRRKATDFERSQLLHSIEKGSEKLAPVGFQDLWKKGVDFKAANEQAWKALGGETLEGYGMAHVATKEVAEQARKQALKGGKIYASTKTPNDIHREWMKVDGKVTNIKDAEIVYAPEKGGYVQIRPTEVKPGVYKPKPYPVKVEQASAQEINNALVKQGKKEIFQENLPLAAARMGISTGRKQAGVEFLKAVEGLKSEEAIKLANETYEKMTNIESLNKAIKMFDSIQNIWKTQSLLGPSYHLRNFAGNLWNNYLADVQPAAYAMAGNLQNNIRRGVLNQADKKLVQEMEKHGIIGTGQYSADISQAIADEVGRPSFNPLSQRFGVYKVNKAIGSAIEDNAKIAHYLSKRAEGYGAKEAADSVKKYLFDYGDLTFAEKNLFKRIMPFYTWTSKNLPLQIQQFVQNPGKFSKIATTKDFVEAGVEQPNEKYMSPGISDNAPIRIRKDANGNTQYFLLGQWLPAAAALNFLSRPLENTIGMISPIAKLPYETIADKSLYFQNTLGEYENLRRYPGDKASWLGLDLDPKAANALRSLRPLNEFDKLNPGDIFGGKNTPSIWRGTFDNASSQKYGRYTPESTQLDRIINLFTGKISNYNPVDQKTFYDRDTADKVVQFDAAILRARKNKQLDLAEKLIKQKNEFLRSRNGLPKSSKPYYQ